MNPIEFTQTTNEAIVKARDLALFAGHVQFTPVHVAVALISDHNAIFWQAILNASGSEEGPNLVKSIFNQAMEKFPTQNPPPNTSAASTPLINAIHWAQSSRKSQDDTHLAIDQLILGLLEDSKIGDLLKEARVSTSRVKSEVEKLRDAKPTKIESDSQTVEVIASGDIVFQALKTYGSDLLEQVGKLNPMIGRDEEIQRVIEILSRRTKNNPILTGEPSVGKLAVVKGLAQRIVKGDVPSNLVDVKLFALDIRDLVAKANSTQEFKESLISVLKEVEEAKRKIIIFVDEIHIVLGASQIQNYIVASNLFKPMFARGQIRCIGATTLEEYRKYVENDTAYERWFQQVNVAEPSVADTITTLEELKETYEEHHGVRIQYQALVVAAQLSARYITECRLPDKAIDLLDEACSNVKVQLDSQPEEIYNIERKIARLKIKLDVLDKEKDQDSRAQLVEVRKQFDDLGDKLQPLKMKYTKEKERMDELRRLKQERAELLLALEKVHKGFNLPRVVELRRGPIQEVEEAIAKLEKIIEENVMVTDIIGPEQIAKVVSRRTSIPVTKLDQNEKVRLMDFANGLHQRVVGQDEIVKAVTETVLRSRLGLGRPQQPIGSFLFLGPTGVGKTELAKALAEQLFDDINLLIRFDMSEFMEQHSVSRLIGSPPGYLGHLEGGQLTEAVKKQPYSVILFDEVEKAHSNVFNTLLQVFDDGRLTDGQGCTVDFTNTLIIMTSNIGADYLLKALMNKCTMESARESVKQEVRKHFKPELLNRLDEIVVFDPLSHEQLAKVVRLLLKDVAIRVAKKGVALSVSEAALGVMLVESYDPAYGARPIRRWLDKWVVNKLTDTLLKSKVDENSTVYIDAASNGHELTYQVEKDGGLMNGAGQRSDFFFRIHDGPRSDFAQVVKKMKMKIEEIDGNDNDVQVVKGVKK
ncbi:chaperone protein ClpB1-like [Camellia sinensis]|uniref:chaperone protein ClpB1-like n=1 Tax=Camellia sinensis TaxID=4442 RepID=UPI001035593E|nr:chaperone protein ClpB1-like [Camellia sinensis]